MPELKAPNVRIYRLNIIISACVESIMKYRLEVLEGKEIVAFIDFAVKR